MSGMTFMDNCLVRYELNSKTHAVSGILINGADLRLALYDRVRDSVEFWFDDELVSVVQQEKKVEVLLTSSKQEIFDVLIGANWVHSKTRELVFGTEFEKNLGKACFAFIVPNRTKMPIAQERELLSIKGVGWRMAQR
jgi:2-polyprenyl-6-methoxyphenol hydroxylase-like FAD-dependent oxidoreductase